MQYFIKLNSEKIYFKSKNISQITPTIKKIFNRNTINIFDYLKNIGLNVQLCAICKTSYNPYFDLEITISPENEVKIINVINGHRSYNYEKYNKNYCYSTNINCPGIKMNSNSIEFISLTLNLNTDEAIKYIHDNNKSPFYLKNHSSSEEYSKSQSRSKDFYIKKYGEIEGNIKYTNFCKNQKYSTSKMHYLNNYGLIEGERLWAEISKKKAITLANMTTLYGEEQGILKLENWKASVSKSNSQLIEELGVTEGLKKIEQINAKRLVTLSENGKIIIPSDKRIDYLIYHHLVIEETNYSLLLYGNNYLGKNWKINKKELKLHLDHIFSIKSGFMEGISPKIIGNIENLRLITSNENTVKKDKNAMSYSELMEKIMNSKYGK